MLYPIYMEIKDDTIQTIGLVSNQNKRVNVIIVIDDKRNFIDVNCKGKITLAEQAQLKALINYLSWLQFFYFYYIIYYKLKERKR